ncbi:sugar phosphate isomerase/epimerase family protein [Bacillus suaedae]|uniref:Sugar phosphate isomerase/epimerase n=1 Tax=Halalkalibacter suaedae TaxID=2822140 RepID=A0A940WUS5_9BACI|nr:TIM barrel protein [Bacillus suaedae]MBP3952666.1 sugar phosphate isomerase/epimerase [Bacillus suaedae]
MNLSLCTISFRHHLYSIDQLAHWAATQHFQAIELWGVHAKNLSDQSHYNASWLESYGLKTSMLSDYLPLDSSIPDMMRETRKLSTLAKHWGTSKIRTFVGRKASVKTSKEERAILVERIKMICEYVESQGQSILVETHPNTLTDTLASTLQLISETNHPALRVNFDVLHIWESGVDPIEAVKQLQPHVSHFHFKNISSREHLHVFAPDNVYAAAGSRKGMVPLFEGAVNFREFLLEVFPMMKVEASLEWFGPSVKEVLAKDGEEVRKMYKIAEAIT